MWEKKGLLYQPSGRWWNQTHCFLPTAYNFGDRIRVYFTGLDENLYGRIGYVEFDENMKIIGETLQPILDIGPAGAFDDCGVNPSCILLVETMRLYYIGWQRHARVPYSLFTGLAISKDGGETFERYSTAPILDRRDGELGPRTAPCVQWDGMFFHIWYVSGNNEWTEQRGHLVPTYNLKYAISRDGINWGHPETVLEPEGKEFGLGRPWVFREGGKWKMYFSARQKEIPYYRIGYAESWDGREWVRGEDPITVSESGWDSEMVCYASVCGDVLFYCGNEHGKEGFGYAIRAV